MDCGEFAGLAGESSSDSEDDDDDDDEVEDSEGGEQMCPPGCDPSLYDKVSLTCAAKTLN